MTPAEIPGLQSQRVALYEQRFGKFDSGKNAYWSLRKERPVTLAEGARFDADMRAGRLAPAVRTGIITRVTQRTDVIPSGAPPARQVLGYPSRLGGRMGWWKHTVTGQMESGNQFFPPSRMAGWRWTLNRPGAVAPQEKFLHMPTEARRIDALPATPPPGPARPPAEPLFEAIMRQLREKQAGPATSVAVVRPAFATPARSFASASPAPIAAGFDMKKLALPLALVAGAFVVSKLV